MGTRHQPLAFVSVSDLIRDKSINAGDHEACHHPFVISTSFMTPDEEEEVNVKDVREEDHDDLDTLDECYEYTKNMTRAKRVPNDPNKLGDGTIKKVSPETIKSSSPTATSQAGEFSENCSLVMGQQRPGGDRGHGHRPASKVSPESELDIRGDQDVVFCILPPLSV